MEVLVLLAAVAFNWCFSKLFLSLNKSFNKSLSGVLRTGVIGQTSMSPMLGVGILTATGILTVLLVEQLVLQNNRVLVGVLHLGVLAFFFNLPSALIFNRSSDGLLSEDLLFTVSVRFFGVTFWYVVIPGIFGAAIFFFFSVAYSAILRHGNIRLLSSLRVVIHGFQLLFWMPAQLLAFSYAFVGDFDTSFVRRRAEGARSGFGLRALILASACGALNSHSVGLQRSLDGAIYYQPSFGPKNAPEVNIRQSSALLLRVGVLWALAIFSLLVIA